MARGRAPHGTRRSPGTELFGRFAEDRVLPEARGPVADDSRSRACRALGVAAGLGIQLELESNPRRPRQAVEGTGTSDQRRACQLRILRDTRRAAARGAKVQRDRYPRSTSRGHHQRGRGAPLLAERECDRKAHRHLPPIPIRIGRRSSALSAIWARRRTLARRTRPTRPSTQ